MILVTLARSVGSSIFLLKSRSNYMWLIDALATRLNQKENSGPRDLKVLC